MIIVLKSGQTIILDREIIWLETEKIGNPPAWTPKTNYKIGDSVVPTNPTGGQGDLMFQVIGFRGQSAAAEGAFDNTIGNRTIDGTIEWEAIAKDKAPPKLKFDEYFLIDESITVGS